MKFSQLREKLEGQSIVVKRTKIEDCNVIFYNEEEKYKISVDGVLLDEEFENLLDAEVAVKEFLEILEVEEVTESTKEYEKSLRAIARDKQLKSLSKKDKVTLGKIADLLAKANEGVGTKYLEGNFTPKELNKLSDNMKLNPIQKEILFTYITKGKLNSKYAGKPAG